MKNKDVKKEIKKPKNKILSFIGKFFKITFKIIKFSIIFIIIIGIGSGAYVGYKIYPMVMEAKAKSYDKFASISDNTFSRYGDTVIYDSKQVKIGEINTTNYKYATIENISQYVQDGYIAVEDKNFKTQNGVDYTAILRAGIEVVKHKGKITQGGSTITEQVIKNNLLTQEKTYKRKLVEFFLAQELEKEYSKRKIMEFYVDTNFYGNNCYGIETASKYYLSKSAKDLTLSESAMFVGMSNNANMYNPINNPKLVKEKRDFVLKRMLEEVKITQTQYDKAIKEELKLKITKEVNKPESYQVSYALDSAIAKLMEIDGFKFQYTFKDVDDYNNYRTLYKDQYSKESSKIRSGGYTIYTSLESGKQAILQKAVDKNLENFTKKEKDGRYEMQGAAVAVDNKTGYVVAIVGGRGTSDQYNRGFLSARQPGSSIKPLIAYTPAFDTGKYYPSLKVIDEKVTLPNGKDGPKNFGKGYRGDISIREALGRSVNTVAFKLLEDITPNKGLEYLAKMKFASLTYQDNDNLAMALGGFTYGARVTDMAKAYSTLVNHGEYSDNTCITKIELQNQGIVYNGEVKKTPVYDTDSAYMMVDMLKTAMTEDYGTSHDLQVDGVITGAKTGTTSDQKDGWMCGMSAYYSVSVWTGYDMPRQVDDLYGSTYPGLIWQQIMTGLHAGLPEQDFEKPEGIKKVSINWKGEPVDYNSGTEDLISQKLMQKASREVQKTADDNTQN